MAAPVRIIMIFLAVFALYGWTQSAASTFLDPDSFYHLKMTQLLMQRGVVLDFPWLPFTTLAHDYADHHLLYHLLCIPFVASFGPFIGMKVATAAFGAIALTSLYALLLTLGARWPVAFTLLAATSSSFMFRMNLAKASSLSVALLMLALIAIVKNRPIILFFLSWAYVWLHGGWPIMGVVVGTFLAARVFTDILVDKHPIHSWASPWYWRRLLRKSRAAVQDFVGAREVRHAVAAAGGLMTGLVINPYFPRNLKFYWEQIVQIALVGYKDKIGVGMEWYPFPAWRFLAESGAVFFAVAVCLALLVTTVFWDDVGHRRSLTREEAGPLLAAVMLAMLFFALTLRSRRHVEYFVPFAVLAIALLFSAILERLDVQALASRFRTLIPKFQTLPLVLVTYLAVLFIFFGVRDAKDVRSVYGAGIPFTKYEKAANWLAANVPAAEVVVHSDWDDFPMLFLHDDLHRYMAGLDATFFYRQDPARYWKWVELTTGKLKVGLAKTVINDFGSHTVLIENDHKLMRTAVEADPAFRKSYQDEDVAIYVVSK